MIWPRTTVERSKWYWMKRKMVECERKVEVCARTWALAHLRSSVKLLSKNWLNARTHTHTGTRTHANAHTKSIKEVFVQCIWDFYLTKLDFLTFIRWLHRWIYSELTEVPLSLLNGFYTPSSTASSSINDMLSGFFLSSWISAFRCFVFSCSDTSTIAS